MLDRPLVILLQRVLNIMNLEGGQSPSLFYVIVLTAEVLTVKCLIRILRNAAKVRENEKFT